MWRFNYLLATEAFVDIIGSPLNCFHDVGGLVRQRITVYSLQRDQSEPRDELALGKLGKEQTYGERLQVTA